jgi:hypothetical protein
MVTVAKKEAHPLDALAAGDPKRVIALMLWVARMRQPDLYVQINEHDIKGFDDCVNYLKVVPQVKIYRPEGMPAQPAIPAQGNRRAIAARPAIPPKPYVIVALVDQKGDAIVPVENNQEDFDAQAAAKSIIRWREKAPDLAQQLLNQARSGEYSLAVMQECADALVALARSG